jgi:hypothetical protein
LIVFRDHAGKNRIRVINAVCCLMSARLPRKRVLAIVAKERVFVGEKPVAIAIALIVPDHQP